VLNAARGRITVTGYTDSSGTPAINDPLSLARAATIGRWIEANSHVTSTRVSTAGHGAADPVADNATARGRAANRRVVIQIPVR
jgi:outer membrane protein OmpA-like peptidoglycan-associated protein